MSPQRVIGLDGKLPWHYPSDLKRFRKRTLGTTIIMGRKTWESLGEKTLPKRRNIVITSSHLTGVETFSSINTALEKCDNDIWFIGGAMLYESALPYCDFVDITHIPDQVFSNRAVYFPELNLDDWTAGPITPFSEDDRLTQQTFYRQGS
jgi:dihydrofolate reductase